MNHDSAVSFGHLLRQLRKRVAMNQEDLAAAVDYSISFISSLERGTRLPQIEFVSQTLVPALGLQDEPRLATKLVELAALARNVRMPGTHEIPRFKQVIEIDAAAEAKSSLPISPTAIIGRGTEVKALCNRITGHRGRLLTLLGPPGVGKTRLALEMAEQLSFLNRDGAQFIALSTVQHSAQLASTILVGLGLSNAGTKSPEEKLINFLRRREVLLVLDNFEQLLSKGQRRNPATSLLATLLSECPSLTIIVTSRTRLHLRAEQRYSVRPLNIDAATQLFVQRAQSHDAQFEAINDVEPTVREICEQLDCLPLAIELAAARIVLLTPVALLVTLQQHRLDVLVDGAVDLPPHQRTLRSAIQGSYALLNEDEKSLFGALGVFVGGFDLDAVESLNYAPDVLESLISKSLLDSRVLGNNRRFRMLETVREFALEQLVLTDQCQAYYSHLTYFSKLAQAAAEQMQTPRKVQSLDRLELEHDNFRAALRWGIDNAPQIALFLAADLKEFWSMRGYDREATAWLYQALSAEERSSTNRAEALLALSSSERRLGNYAEAAEALAQAKSSAEELQEPELWLKFYDRAGWHFYDLHDHGQTHYHFERGLALARSLQNNEYIVLFLAALAHLQRDLPKYRRQVSEYLEECLSLLRNQNNMQVRAFVLQQYGALEVANQHYQAAARHYQEMLNIYREIGDKFGIAWGLELLAEAEWFQQDLDAAQAYHDEAYQLFTEIDNPDGIMTVLHHLGNVARRKERVSEAKTFYKKSLAYARMLQNRHIMARCLAGLGGVALLLSDYEQAALFTYAAQREFDSLSPFLAPTDLAEFQEQYANIAAHAPKQVGFDNRQHAIR